MKRNNKTDYNMFGGYRSWCSVVFIGRSFTLVFNLSPRLRGAAAAAVAAAAAYCKPCYTNFQLVLYHLRRANTKSYGAEEDGEIHRFEIAWDFR